MSFHAKAISLRARVAGDKQLGDGMTAWRYEPASNDSGLSPPVSSRNRVT